MTLTLLTISSVNAVDLTLNPNDSINDAIDNININGVSTSNNTITLNKGTYNKTTDIKNYITIDNINLTIIGNGPRGSVIIDAQKSANIFNILGNSNITFINIMFINGNSTGNGGAINNPGSKLTIINCDFYDNIASGYGGAISNAVKNLRIENSKFYNNLASGGGSNGNGGAIHTVGDSPTIVNSNFTNNTAKLYGGAIYMPLSSSNYAIIDGCIFKDNTAINYEGGAIFSAGNDHVKVINSKFINNSASNTGGGGIHSTGGNYFNISDCSFIGNTAKGGNSKGGAVNIAFANSNGNPKGDFATVTNCIFINNTAGKYGGAIMVDYANNCTVINSSFINNSAAYGSAILIGLGNNFTLINSNVTNNKGNSVIYIYGNNAVIQGSNIYNNSHGIMIASGSNNKVNYNRIFNNTNGTGYNLDDSGANSNLDFNWWGDNKPKVNGILNNYFIMSIVNLTDLNSTGKVTFNYTFELNTGEYADSSLLPYFVTNVYLNITDEIYESFDARNDKIFDVTLKTSGNVLYSFETDNQFEALEGEVVIQEPPIEIPNPEPTPNPNPDYNQDQDPSPDEEENSSLIVSGSETGEKPTQSGSSSKTAEKPIQKSEKDDKVSKNKATVNTIMKSTGIPIFVILMLFAIVLGALYRKKY